jgi:hypothetical protein
LPILGHPNLFDTGATLKAVPFLRLDAPYLVFIPAVTDMSNPKSEYAEYCAWRLQVLHLIGYIHIEPLQYFPDSLKTGAGIFPMAR